MSAALSQPDAETYARHAVRERRSVVATSVVAALLDQLDQARGHTPRPAPRPAWDCGHPLHLREPDDDSDRERCTVLDCQGAT